MLPQILERLKSRGYRLTRARKAIIEILLGSRQPLDVNAVRVLLTEKNLNVNKTTVYRELDFLKGENLIREIQLGDGKRRYEVLGDDHHHHLVCMNCDMVECVELERCMEEEERRIFEKSSFRAINHSLKFFGLCAKCQ